MQIWYEDWIQLGAYYSDEALSVPDSGIGQLSEVIGEV